MKPYQKILLALIVGVLLGHLIPSLLPVYSYLGAIFIRLLKFIIVPIVFASLLTSVANMGNSSEFGKLGVQTFLYFILTTAFAITVGLTLTAFIKPGVIPLIDSSLIGEVKIPEALPLGQVIMNIIPDHPIRALIDGNMLQVIFMSISFGFALRFLPRDISKPMISWFDSLNELMMVITGWVLALSPIGIACLIAELFATVGVASLMPLIKYIFTVLLGLLIYGFVIVPLYCSVLAKQNPLTMFRRLSVAIVTAFSTASSAASLPIALKSLMKRCQQPIEVTSFVMPVGITVNMNGTALFQGVATVFIAQLYQVPLSLTHYGLILTTTLLAAIGSAAVPSAGLITLSLVLTTVGIPLEGIGIIIAVDRFLDMCRTSVNMWSNCVATMVLTRLSNINNY